MKRSTRFLLLCALGFVCFNIAAFWCGTYERILAPDSSTHAFDAGLARADADAKDRTRDVLVLGDSRIFSGLDAAMADRAAPGLHFVNAAVPGTTPRCWYVFDRVLDPHADRFRAVVIPLDTYADDDSAIGSIDGDDRAIDLSYVALRTSVPDAFTLAASFPSSTARGDALASLLLRGPLLRADIASLAADPAKRFADVRRGGYADVPAVRHGDLVGLRADFVRNALIAPTDYPATGLDELRRQVLYVGKPSASYARYRERWLAPIVARYRAAAVPVVFVRIPTRPLHRDTGESIGGFLSSVRDVPGVSLLDRTPYVALERPELFVDADHLNDVGAEALSTRLGHDVKGVLAKPRAPAAVVLAVDRTLPLSPRSLEIGAPIPFQSATFFFFFAIVAALYFATPKRGVRRTILLVASWYFYARWNAWYLLVLLALTATDYAFALWIERAADSMRRALLAAGIAVNLLFLGTAKYADFISGTVASALHLAQNPWALHVLVPIGISFHTFQSISYLVDVHRGRTKAVRDPFDYALYLAFFPQLLAGPIVRAHTFFGELFGPRARRALSQRDLAAGATQIAIGLVKKFAIADRFASVSDAYFAHPLAEPGAAAAWSAALAFALQIYFDFSGYSDIAIGLARVLGFRFPSNFKRPYLAASPQEFWRRWHMTLSFWLRDYVYIPLGGSACSSLVTVRNLMVTMLLGGLWHGANWTFVAWGAYHGALLAGQSALAIPRVPSGLPARIATTAITFALVTFGWVLFRASSFAQGGAVFAEMFSRHASTSVVGPGIALACVALFACEIAAEWKPMALARLPLVTRSALMVATLVVFELGADVGSSPPFIYFRF